MSNTATAPTNLPAAQAAPAAQSDSLPSAGAGIIAFKPLITQGAPEDFSVTAVEDMLDIMEQIRSQEIAKAEVASINMVSRYLKFSRFKNIPLRRSFVGWTARPLIDYKTKEPMYDENTGEQLYGPAVIFYNHEGDVMEINQAFDILKCFHEHHVPRGTMVEITFLGLETTEKGNNKQTFKIVFLK